jgi:CubicO group peptidase (beta-lactamase class C family)
MHKRFKCRRAAVVFLLALSLNSALPAVAQVNQPAVSGADGQIQKMLADNKIPALGIGEIRGGKLVQIKVFGEIRKGETASFDTIFNVASLTKPVVAMTALRLASAGRK